MTTKNTQEKEKKKNLKKNRAILIRAPESYLEELKKIAQLSGLSVNAVCLELLRVGIRERLKELKAKS